jgi:hypothetical protein
MLIFTTGCSHTYGTDIAFNGNPKGRTYPYLLMKKLECNIQDRSYQGYSNRDIVDSLVNFTSKNQVDYAVIQFTHPDRFRTPNRTINCWRHHHPVDFVYEQNGLAAIYDSPLDGTTKADCDFYKQYYSPQEIPNGISWNTSLLELSLDIKLVHHYLKDLNIPYTFIVWPKMAGAITKRNVFKTLDHQKFLNYDPSQNKIFSMASLLASKNFKKPHDSHFGPDAHEFIANSIIEHMYYNKQIRPDKNYNEKEKEIIHTYS